MQSKWLVAVAAIGLAAVPYSTAFAAAASTATAGGAPARSFTVGLASEGLNAPFPVAIANGVREVGAADHVKVIVLDGKLTVTAQEADVQDLVAEHVSGIIIDVIDPGATIKMIRSANAAHIPVMLVHGYAGSGPKPAYPGVAYEIDENEVQAGVAAGHLALDAAPKGGQVAVITGTPGYVAVTEREDGFKSVLPSQFKVVSVQPGNWTAVGGYSACASIFEAHPNLALAYTESDDMALGCMKAVAASSAHPKIVSIGGESELKADIASGKVYGTICYEPKTEGEMVMKAMVAELTGKAHYDRTVVFYDTPSITKANLEDCGWQW
ncbi:MAG: sugar ABC transporter substrate-binding protein [Acetobacteraceae bacterium]